MDLQIKDAPRQFAVNEFTVYDYGKVGLNPWEMISVVTGSGLECDITMTDWGMYLGPSLNGRLKKEGFKTALVINEFGKIFVNAVEQNKIDDFKKYIQSENSRVVCWLDEWLADK